mmetsp:Transcript_11139/g.21224  ORF Transcript_11139/g.21224 Transcript_11139/m.21224 type:complete len:111 (-) Transcript_11139:372-704(-)
MKIHQEVMWSGRCLTIVQHAQREGCWLILLVFLASLLFSISRGHQPRLAGVQPHVRQVTGARAGDVSWHPGQLGMECMPPPKRTCSPTVGLEPRDAELRAAAGAFRGPEV